MLEKLLRKLLIPVAVGITALTSCSSPSDNPSGCLVDSDCLSGRYCRKEEGQKYGVCAFHEDILGGDVSSEVVGCGNSVCEEGENCSSCALDCGECKSLCESCEGDYQCGDGSGKDMCINFPDSKSLYYNKKKFCAQDCTVNACPTGYDCMDVFYEEGKINRRQCVPPMKGPGAPLCITTESCDSATYKSSCDGPVLSVCDHNLNLVRKGDCGFYGLQCGYFKYEQLSVCFGFSKIGDSCPEWYDCDLLNVDACISVGEGLTTYCSLHCTEDSNCPAGYFCKVINPKDKVCSKH